MYGETGAASLTRASGWGLSPHVRGNHDRATDQLVPLRSIPACTGKPFGQSRWRQGSAVYPRMYGETRRAEVMMVAASGLSPHVRGNHHGQDRHADPRGSIPACTGKPPASRIRERIKEVYPRMYGETAPIAASSFSTTGLSPHVRGNHRLIGSRSIGGGSIPACTGKPRAG